MNEERWNLIRDFYVSNFGVSPELVDLMASNDILLMCVSGSSNTSISKVLNIDEKSIKEIISLVLDFDGWTQDLDLNPYSIFNNIALMGRILFRDFKIEIMSVAPHTKISEMEIMYRVCRVYDKISTKLDREWV